MGQELMPFFESAEAATKHAIQASGKEIKDVASALWADKTVTRAQTDLLNALNENRAERLTADQHTFIANYCQRFEFLYYVAHRCSHARPAQVTPEARQAQQQESFRRLAGEMKALLGQMGEL
jgi:hypothetical protein